MSRRLSIWILLLLVFVALVVVGAVAGSDTSRSTSAPLVRQGVSYAGTKLQDGSSNETVAIVPVTGTITNGDSAIGGSSTGADDVIRQLDAIGRADDRFDGVILELDTPGGAVLAAAEMHDAIERLQRDHHIPVVAWMRSTAASAGYYIAAPTRRIVAAPTTATGSIGVILSYYDVSKLASDVGVDEVVIKSGKLKDMGSPFRRITDEERAVLQSVIDEAFDGFVGVVAKGRDLSEPAVRKLADGRIYTGRQAKRLGLVDELGFRATAYDAMAKLLDVDHGRELDVVEFRRSYGLLQSLTAGVEPSLTQLATQRLPGGLLSSPGSLRSAGGGRINVEYRAEL